MVDIIHILFKKENMQITHIMPTNGWYWKVAFPTVKLIDDKFYVMTNQHFETYGRTPGFSEIDDKIQDLKDHLLLSFGRQGSFEGTDIESLDAYVENIKTLCPESMQPFVSQWWAESRESILKLQAVVSAKKHSMFSGRCLQNPYVLDFCV